MTSALEDQKPLDITQWLTLNTAFSSSKLPIGQSPDCLNTWVDEKPGSVITANGYRKVGAIPSGNPVTFCINYFKTSSGAQTFIVSDNNKVWKTIDFQNFTEIITGLSSAFQIRGLVIRDKLWLTNGSDAVRTYDGSAVAVLDGTSGTPDVPKGRYIAYHDERVWLYHIPSNRSQLAFSALTDSSGTIITPDDADAWPSSNTLQISQGDADFGTGLCLYRNYLYMFKQYSIWRLIGYDEYTYSRVKCRASTGTRFNESIQIVDNLVHMIGVDGIYEFNGEDATRISDLIDPASTSQASFGFNDLQQPNSNNQFWEVTSTTDWNAGTVIPTNATINDSLAVAPIDSTAADFAAGSMTNVEYATYPSSGLMLSRQSTGGSNESLYLNQNAYFDDSNNGAVIYGDPSSLTDNNLTIPCGMGIRRSSSNRIVVDLSRRASVGRVRLEGVQADTNITATVQVNTGTYQTKYGTQGTWVTVGTFQWAPSGSWNPQTVLLDFAGVDNAIQASIFFNVAAGSYQLSEFEIYTKAFQTSGKFISKAFDYTDVPASLGNLYVHLEDAINDAYTFDTVTFNTQSSDDGSAWDAEVPVTMSTIYGGAINSTPKRYLRWIAYLSGNGLSSLVLKSAYVGVMYQSAIHNTGGSIFAWGAFEAPPSLAGQTVAYYYRGAATEGAVTGASWNLIPSGGVPSFATTNVYIQFKIEISGGSPTNIPFVSSVTINWVKGTGVDPQTLQNVASFFWRNRYWMAAAMKGSTSNDTILVRGKRTFQSPWQLKDWPILSFCRYQDGLYGGSSVDGSIYQLDTGYSKDGSAMDSYFETGDFTFMGNHIHCHEVELEVERTGSYNLKFGVSIDKGSTWTEYDVDLTESTFATSYWKKILIDPGTTPIIRFRVRTNGVDQPFEVHNLRAYYEIRSARGSLR